MKSGRVKNTEKVPVKKDTIFRFFLIEIDNMDGYVENRESLNIMNYQIALGKTPLQILYIDECSRKNEYNNCDYNKNEDNDKCKIEDDIVSKALAENKDLDFNTIISYLDPLNVVSASTSYFDISTIFTTSSNSASTSSQNENQHQHGKMTENIKEKNRKNSDTEMKMDNQKIQKSKMEKKENIEKENLANRIRMMKMQLTKKSRIYFENFVEWTIQCLAAFVVKLIWEPKNENNSMNENGTKPEIPKNNHWGIQQLLFVEKVVINGIKVEVFNICDSREMIYLKNFEMVYNEFECVVGEENENKENVNESSMRNSEDGNKEKRETEKVRSSSDDYDLSAIIEKELKKDNDSLNCSFSEYLSLNGLNPIPAINTLNVNLTNSAISDCVMNCVSTQPPTRHVRTDVRRGEGNSLSDNYYAGCCPESITNLKERKFEKYKNSDNLLNFLNNNNNNDDDDDDDDFK